MIIPITRVGDVRIEDCLDPLDFRQWIDQQEISSSDEAVQQDGAPAAEKNIQ